MRTTPRTLVAFATCAALLAFAGCGDEEKPPRPDPTPTEQVESPSATTPTADAAPAEPELPDAATQPTEDGARAFITYYWDLINYAQATGDVTALRAASSPRCTTCQTGLKGIKNLYKGGGRTEGGAYSIAFDKVQKLDATTGLIVVEAVLSVTHGEQTITNPDGTQQVSVAGTAGASVGSQWHTDRWLLEVMDLQQ